jgi:UMF1 family MFS transporter
MAHSPTELTSVSQANDSHVSTDRTRFPINDRREIFGWMMYDWANSAFSTTIVGALFGPYITRLAQDAVGDNGVVLSLGFLGAVTAKSLSTFCVALAVGLQVFVLPVLGAIADYSNLKKRLMAVFCYLGVAATCVDC